MRRDDEEPLLPDDGAGASNSGRGEDDYSRKARALVWTVAGGFIVVGLMNLGLYWFQCKHNQTTPGVWHCVYLSIPLVIGLGILIRTPALARRIEDWLDE